MKKYFRAFICAFYSFFKFTIIKCFNFKNFRFSPLIIFSPFTEVDLGKKSYLMLSKLVRAKSGVKFKIRDSARVEVGEGTSFNHGCMIVSHNEIKIGSNVQFGPNVLIYDHDHDFRKKDGLKNLEYKTEPVVIGDNVWIGASVIILKGTTIGDGCVVGAGSVVKGRFPSNSLIIQKKETIVQNINKIR